MAVLLEIFNQVEMKQARRYLIRVALNLLFRVNCFKIEVDGVISGIKISDLVINNDYYLTGLSVRDISFLGTNNSVAVTIFNQVEILRYHRSLLIDGSCEAILKPPLVSVISSHPVIAI